MKLSELLNERKGDRSYEALERDCGGVPKAARRLIPIDRLMDAFRWADNLSEVNHQAYMLKQRAAGRIIGRHGSTSAYDTGCRCDDCRAAHNEKSRKFKAARRAKRSQN